ncbi:MAG: LuxR C-terminal-related transcriptional regulator [Pseudomonadota bacterium]
MGIVADHYQFTIKSLEDIRPAALELKEMAQGIGGYKLAATDNIASKAPMKDHEGNVLATSVFGWADEPDQWWRNSRLALTSPLARACRYESEPFWCNIEGFYPRQPNVFLDKIDISDFEKRSGLRAAIVLPVHLPLGQIGAISLAPGDQRIDLQDHFDQHADDLQILAHRFITGYAKVTRGRSLVPADCQLTKREVECLRWAAVGKTDREISMILSRSHATIRFHIKNAGEKLNTVNRSQTIFKAAQLGFLGTAA